MTIRPGDEWGAPTDEPPGERVRGGDLTVRVDEVQTGDELAGLMRAFNRMTGQLAAQRGELMDAYSTIDERRRFTETVLSGVSAAISFAISGVRKPVFFMPRCSRRLRIASAAALASAAPCRPFF